MKVNVVKVISDKTFTNKNGKEQNVVTYFIVTDNGVRVPIKPIYEMDKNAYSKLDCLADVKDKRNG